MTNDPEVLALGRFYRFVHERAEYLRLKEAAAASTDSEAHDAAAAHSTSAQEQAQPGVYTNGKK